MTVVIFFYKRIATLNERKLFKGEFMTWGFFMQTMGNRVKALRISKRMTQQQLADAIDVTQPAITKIEKGKTQVVTSVVLDKLAKELSSTSSYILHGSTNSEDHEHAMISAEMVAIFMSLPLVDKETILRIARSMSSEKKQAKKVPQL
jgi:transcriptional regulator with XRE-family HTH domain